MTAELGCEQVRELGPELALDIVDGQIRDAAMQHVGVCTGCRNSVSELSWVTDELLLLAPEHEPPVGFESRVLTRLDGADQRGGGRRRTSRLLLAATIALSIALGAGVVVQATAGDRRLAESYRAVLGVGQGSFFGAAPLLGPNGRGGTVYGYEGEPSWVFIVPGPAITEGERFHVRVLTRDGRTADLGTADLDVDAGGWGSLLPVSFAQVRELRLQPLDGSPGMYATFEGSGPWGDG